MEDRYGRMNKQAISTKNSNVAASLKGSKGTQSKKQQFFEVVKGLRCNMKNVEDEQPVFAGLKSQTSSADQSKDKEQIEANIIWRYQSFIMQKRKLLRYMIVSTQMGDPNFLRWQKDETLAAVLSCGFQYTKYRHAIFSLSDIRKFVDLTIKQLIRRYKFEIVEGIVGKVGQEFGIFSELEYIKEFKQKRQFQRQLQRQLKRKNQRSFFDSILHIPVDLFHFFKPPSKTEDEQGYLHNKAEKNQKMDLSESREDEDQADYQNMRLMRSE